MPKSPAKPRWVPGNKPAVKDVEVELADLGATVLLRKPSVTALIEAQKLITKDSDEFQDTVNLVSIALVEPDLSAEQLASEVADWTTDDWLTLQGEALELIGMKRLGEIQARFQTR